jgi:hypothetical protein
MTELRRRYRQRVLRPLLAVGALAALAVVLTPAGSAGTTSKPFAAVFGSVVAADGSVPLTITDEAKNQLLGSANVVAPAGVSIVGTTAPTANLDPAQTFPTQTLMLRNLNLDPPSNATTFSTTIYVAASSCGAFTWSIVAHQSNDYNSNPGNALYLDSANSSLNTVATAGCHLAWVYQPASANQSATITDTAFTPSGSGVHNVAVAVEDSTNQPVNLNSGTATLSMAGGSFDACGTGCTPSFSGLTSTTFHNGVATFPNFQSAYTGSGFTMQANAYGLTSPASTPPFVIEPNGLNCVGKDPCVLDTSFGTGGSADISGHGGNFLYLAVSSTQIPSDVLAAGGGCASFTGTGVTFAEMDARNGNGTVDITLSIPNKKLKAAYGPNYGNPDIPICAGAKRIDANNQPVDCHTDVTNGLPGFADRTLDPSTHVFNGGYSTAQCGSDGYWWGILGTYQDPIGLGFDANLIPLITSWGGTLTSGTRTVVVHEPAGWDGHFGY